MKVTVIRTAMCGGGLSYDVYVLEADCPEHVRNACPGGTYYTRICRGDKTYLDYEHATLSESHAAMEQGWEKYQSYLAHEKECRREMLGIARIAFDELHKYRGDSLPTLWLNGLLPKSIKETSKEVEITIGEVAR